MVTSAGFNALLKIVEEPPEHLKFIFATTEPEKVIGTIRSRTHHYPFRLVPPEPLIAYLEQLCSAESTQVDPGVLPLVVRAGTGSVRDTLSVLDQLIAGAAEGRVDYDLAVNLLGFTPEALLDDVVDALAADDSQTVFKAVDRVVQSGQDPRRFVEDLLDRFRDLVIARAMPDQASVVLHGVPEDQVRRLAAQAAQLSRAELSRLADITNEALSEMVGATSPRLHLELLMARLLLPASDDTHRGLSARLEALERRLAYAGGSLPDGGGAPAAPVSPAGGSGSGSRNPVQGEDDGHGGASRGGPAQGGPGRDGTAAGLSGAALARAAMRRQETAQDVQAPPAAAPAERLAPSAQAEEPVQSGQAARAEEPAPAQQPARAQQPAQFGQPEPAEHSDRTDSGDAQTGRDEPTHDRAEQPVPPAPRDESTEGSPSPAAPSTPGGGQGTNSVEMVRRAWPDILAALEDSSRLVWMLVKDNASVAGFDGRLLTIGFTQDGPRHSLLNRRGDQVLAEAVHRVLGIRPELDLILGGDAPQGDRRPKAEGRPAPAAGHVNGGAQHGGPAASTGTSTVPGSRQPQPESRPQAPHAPETHPPAQSQEDRLSPTAAQDGPSKRADTLPPRPAPQRSGQEGAPQQHEPARRPAKETTPPPAPSPDAWGTPPDSAPDWGGPSGSADDDPWADIPEFDPDADMEDSPGPEGWSPEDSGPEAAQTFGAAGTSTEDGSADDDLTESDPADSTGGPTATPDDTDSSESAEATADGSPSDASVPGRGDASASPGGSQDAPDLPGSRGRSTPDVEGVGSPEPSEDGPMPAYNPGPLVPDVEPSIPVFARPESELRAEFAARFGNTRPEGFDRPSEEDARPNTPDADTAGPSSAEPSRDDTPDPGVPAPDHGGAEDPSADVTSDRSGPHHSDAAAEPADAPDRPGGADWLPSGGAPSAREAAFAAAAAGNDPKALAQRGGGHPASWFGALMQRMAEGGSAEPPVNQGSGGPGGPAAPGGPGGPGGPDLPGTSGSAGEPGAGSPAAPGASEGGRPSASDLSRPRGEAAGGGEGPSSGSARPTLDPRAAAVQAAREAARGRGPRPEPNMPADGPSVSWEDEVASEDDIPLEESGLVGRAVVERILHARLIEELPNS